MYSMNSLFPYPIRIDEWLTNFLIKKWSSLVLLYIKLILEEYRIIPLNDIYSSLSLKEGVGIGIIIIRIVNYLLLKFLNVWESQKVLKVCLQFPS